MSFHAVQGVTSTRGLGSYVLGRPAVMVDEEGRPVAGLPSNAAILAHPERHKAAVMRGVLQTPESCGSCHKANLPQSLNGYKWLRAFTTYDEWQQSGWSMQSPMAFFPKNVESIVRVATCRRGLHTGGWGRIRLSRWLMGLRSSRLRW